MNEPRVNLRQVSTRIDIDDYTRIVQILAEGKYKDVSDYVRKLIHNDVANVELSEESKAWRNREACIAIEKRTAKRRSHRSFISRLFGR